MRRPNRPYCIGDAIREVRSALDNHKRCTWNDAMDDPNYNHRSPMVLIGNHLCEALRTLEELKATQGHLHTDAKVNERDAKVAK